MLAQLLPGVRQFRTPFASGLLWIILGWLVVSHHIHREQHRDLFNSFDALGSASKPLGLGFSLALGAYLVGLVSEVLWAPWFRLLPGLSSRGRRSIYRLVTRRLDGI